MSIENVVTTLAKYDFVRELLYLDEVDDSQKEQSLGILDPSNLEQISTLKSPNAKLSAVVTFIFDKLNAASKDTVSALFINNPKAYETSLKLLELAKISHPKPDSEVILLFNNQVREAYAPFKILPEEIWEHVFSSCDVKTLGRLECVSLLFQKKVAESGWALLAVSLMTEEEQKIHCKGAADKRYLPIEFKSKLYVEAGEWTLSQKERVLLETVTHNTRLRAASYISTEFVNAFECMKNSTPTSFKSEFNAGQGSHMKEHTDAREFLRECLESHGILRRMIEVYNESTLDAAPSTGGQEELKESPFFPRTYQELVVGLEQLLARVKKKLEFDAQANPPANPPQ